MGASLLALAKSIYYPMRRVVLIYKRRNAFFTYKYRKERDNISDGSVLSSLLFNFLQGNK